MRMWLGKSNIYMYNPTIETMFKTMIFALDHAIWNHQLSKKIKLILLEITSKYHSKLPITTKF